MMDTYDMIERAGRTAYRSHDKKSEGSAQRFVEMIAKRGHDAVLEFGRIVVAFESDRGFTHELVRHRLASFVQESTRYCNYSRDDARFDRIWEQKVAALKGTYTMNP